MYLKALGMDEPIYRGSEERKKKKNKNQEKAARNFKQLEFRYRGRKTKKRKQRLKRVRRTSQVHVLLEVRPF